MSLFPSHTANQSILRTWRHSPIARSMLCFGVYLLTLPIINPKLWSLPISKFAFDSPGIVELSCHQNDFYILGFWAKHVFMGNPNRVSIELYR